VEIVTAAWLFAAVLAQVPAQKARPVSYVADVAPIFRSSCVGCHNPRTTKDAAISGGLSLERLADFSNVRGRSGTRILVAGRPQASELYLRLVDPSPARRMPKGGRLTPEQIEKVRAWIAGGALEGAAPKPASAPAPAAPRVEPAGGTLDVLLPLERAGVPEGVTGPAALAVAVGPLPRVTALAFSPDGKRLAVGGYRAVVFWNLAEGKVDGVWTGFAGGVQSIAWSASAGIIAAAGGIPGQSGEVRLRLLDQAGLVTERELPALEGHSDVVYCVDVSPDGQRLATASHDRSILVWQVAALKGGAKPTPEKTLTIHSDAVFRARFLPDGRRLVSASNDRTLRVMSLETGKPEITFEGIQHPVAAAAVRPDGQAVVSGGEEPRIRWWNPGQVNTYRYGDGHAVQINDLAFSANGQVLASAGADATVRLWDANSGAARHTLRDGNDWFYTVALSPDGTLCAAGSGDGLVRLWEVESGTLRARFTARPDGPTAQWIAAAPSGHFEGSDAWLKKARVLAGKNVLLNPETGAIERLRSAKQLAAALTGDKLEPIVITPPAPR
jgi:mono/diheme cytochrome c family protein